MSSAMNTKEFPGRFLYVVLQILITLYKTIRSNSVGEAVYHQQHDVCGKEQDRRLSTTQVSKYAQKGKRKKIVSKTVRHGISAHLVSIFGKRRPALLN